MKNEEKEFIKKINIDKAKKKTNICIVLTLISLLTYAIPLMLQYIIPQIVPVKNIKVEGAFDFGIVFEICTFIFILIARKNMSNYDINGSTRFTILAMIPIGWLLIYDLITVFSMAIDIVDFAFLGEEFLILEGIIILDLLMLFVINKDLKKADNPEKYKENTDWFYERLIKWRK